MEKTLADEMEMAAQEIEEGKAQKKIEKNKLIEYILHFIIFFKN